MKILDYLFFRAYSFYDKKRDSIPILRGSIILTLICLFTLLTTVEITTSMLKVDLHAGKVFVVIFILALIEVFRLRYKKAERLELLKERYENEDLLIKRKRGLLIVAYFLFVFVTPFIIAFYLR